MRLVLTVAAVAAIVAGAFQPMYVRMYFVDTARMHATFEELPYRKLPGLRRMSLEVQRRTPHGARVALWTPHGEWERGYRYAFQRVPFLLGDKQVLPMLEPDRDLPTARYLGQADYIACWRGCPSVSGFRTIWRSADGELMVHMR